MVQIYVAFKNNPKTIILYKFTINEKKNKQFGGALYIVYVN